MEALANLLPHHLCSSKSATPLLILNQHSPFTTHISLRPALGRSRSLKTTRPTTTNSSSSGEDGNTLPSTPQPVIPPTDTAEIRFRRGSRKRSKEKQLDNSGGSGNSTKRRIPPKDWESMTFGEKAMELYVGEKGLLFWLNKFAYASIFIIIGAWIIFRFVGPSLGFYQLDTPPLSPSNILKS